MAPQLVSNMYTYVKQLHEFTSTAQIPSLVLHSLLSARFPTFLISVHQACLASTSFITHTQYECAIRKDQNLPVPIQIIKASVGPQMFSVTHVLLPGNVSRGLTEQHRRSLPPEVRTQRKMNLDLDGRKLDTGGL
jgi:preprotein translocase subunit SecY